MRKNPELFAEERVKKLIILANKTKDSELKKYYIQLAKKICNRHKLKTLELGLSKKEDKLVEKKIRISKGKKIVIWLPKE